MTTIEALPELAVLSLPELSPELDVVLAAFACTALMVSLSDMFVETLPVLDLILKFLKNLLLSDLLSILKCCIVVTISLVWWML